MRAVCAVFVPPPRSSRCSGRGSAELVEEDLRELVVVVLARVDEHLVARPSRRRSETAAALMNCGRFPMTVRTRIVIVVHGDWARMLATPCSRARDVRRRPGTCSGTWTGRPAAVRPRGRTPAARPRRQLALDARRERRVRRARDRARRAAAARCRRPRRSASPRAPIEAMNASSAARTSSSVHGASSTSHSSSSRAARDRVEDPVLQRRRQQPPAARPRRTSTSGPRARGRAA